MTNNDQIDRERGNLALTFPIVGTGDDGQPKADAGKTGKESQAEAKAGGSIRLNLLSAALTLASRHFFHARSEIEADDVRTKHVKRLLHSVCEGKPHTKVKQLASLFPSRQHSYKIAFSDVRKRPERALLKKAWGVYH